MQMYTSFAESVTFKEIMYVTNSSVCSLANFTCLVDQVVYLLRDGLKKTPEIPHFRGVLKYIGPGCIELIRTCICCAKSKELCMVVSSEQAS